MPYPVAAVRNKNFGNIGVAPWWMAAGVTPTIAYQPKGAVSQADSYINLPNPGVNNATPGTAPTWATGTGWTFNGLTQHLLTGIVPVGACSAFIQFTGLATGLFSYLFGEYDGTNIFGVYSVDASIQHGYIHGTVAANVGVGITLGNLGLTSAAGYKDGVNEIAITGVSLAGAREIAIGARNTDGVMSMFAGVTIVAFVFYQTVTLNNSQALAIASAMALI